MRSQQGWSSRSGHAEARRGGRDPRCPRERYRGIRPRHRQNIAEKILSNLFAYQKTALTRSGGWPHSTPATSCVPIPRRRRSTADGRQSMILRLIVFDEVARKRLREKFF
jgi:hypothetical protein